MKYDMPSERQQSQSGEGTPRLFTSESTTYRPTKDGEFRIAAVGDLHCAFISPEFLRTVCHEMREKADVVVLCGDLTHHGDPEEATTLLDCLKVLSCPILGVLGNHDYENGMADTLQGLFEEAGVKILDGTLHTIHDIDFVGVKGFGGGFGDYALQPWGESIMKDFVKETRQEVQKLEAALKQSRHSHRVAILHYAPIRETVEGEAEEIIPFLGSSAFEEVLVRNPVDVVFHGHAHHGKVGGRTCNHIPVWNVAMPLLHRTNPGMVPFYVHTLKTGTSFRIS